MIQFRQNDRLPALEVRAFTASGNVDLTAYASIAFRMVSGSTVVTGVATGDVNGLLTYAWGSGDLAVVGVYDAVFLATDGTGRVQTFPTGTNLKIEVIAAI